LFAISASRPITILSQSRLTVTGYGVPAHEHELHSTADQR
jgi:hypothetical protein